MMEGVYFGIDYGSKLTGNTVIAIYQNDQVLFMQVDKGIDADSFILNAAKHFEPSQIFIDAPLSLPGIYRNLPGCENYHFRKADLELRAMSPMFLGGLAARAIELSHTLKQMGIEVYETYPRVMANKLQLKPMGYKGNKSSLKDCTREVVKEFATLKFCEKDIITWHHLDALMALASALNHSVGEHEAFGDLQEGLIII